MAAGNGSAPGRCRSRVGQAASPAARQPGGTSGHRCRLRRAWTPRAGARMCPWSGRSQTLCALAAPCDVQKLEATTERLDQQTKAVLQAVRES